MLSHLGPARRLQQVARHCLERVHEIERQVFCSYFHVVNDRRHLEPGSSERGYFTAGYLQALKDVRELIDSGEFPAGRIDQDGGPHIRKTAAE